MKRINIIALISAIAMIVAFITISLLTRSSPPDSYRSIEGPSQSGVSTNGVFRPGGYIRFSFDTGIDSLGGFYKGTVTTRPVPPDDISIELWEYGAVHYGLTWDDTTMKKSNKPIKIEHTIYIPNEEFLLGESVLFQLRYSLTYPYTISYNLFGDKHKNIEKNILIKLDNTPLTDEEIVWLDEGVSKPKWVFKVNIILLAGSWIALYIAIPKKKQH